jgi:DNA-binding SARP family transcriptional activator/shikimate kinase
VALKLALLGKPKIEFEGEDVNGRLPVKARTLVYFLASNPQIHNRDQLAEWIWEGAANPRGNLRVALNVIRRHLGEDAVAATRDTLSINQNDNFMLDVEEFDNSLRLAGKAVGATERSHLRDAVELYQGDFLQDITIEGIYLNDEWLVPERERLRQQALAAYDRLVNICREQGDYNTGIQHVQTLLQLEPGLESAHRQLMRLYDLTGKRSLAIKQFDICADVLEKEFGVSPADETFVLYRQIVDPPAAEVTESLTPPEEVEKPVPFLAPKLAPFFSGRDEELVDLQEKLQPQATRRLVGLVGPPGVGKSALAIELAHRLRETFPDGVLWMNADLDDPMSVAERWATAYGHDYSRISDLNERTAVLRDLLAEKRALIICDDVTNVVRTRLFLPEKGQSTILLTSRSENIIRRLGAELVNVPVLSLANGRALLASIISEERVAAEEAAAAEIITLLEGLPLAIAIAGQRLAQQSRRKLTLFAAQLGDESARIDLADRDRAIRTSFTVSWNGLDQIQQGVFARLAVFAGRSFAVDAVTAIAEMDYFEALDRLDALVALSLLNDVGDERYRQHALLADFAHEKLSDDDTPYRQMITYFQTFASNHQADYAQLEKEWENFSACIEKAHQLKIWITVIEFTDTLREAWFTRGRYTEARLAFQQACEAAEILSDRQAVARCQLHWGHACTEQNAYEEAETLLIASQQHFVALEDLSGIATAKYDRARIALELARNEKAEKLLDESRGIRERIGDAKGVAQTLYRQARIAFRRSQFDKAKSLGQQALELQAKVDDERDSIPIYRLLTTVAINQLDLESAETYSQTALALCREFQNQPELAVALLGLMRVYREKAEYELAVEAGLRSVEMLTQMGDRRSLGVAYHGFCMLYIKMEQWEQAVVWGERALKLAFDVDDQLLKALASTYLGDSYNCLNDHNRAYVLWTEALQIAQKLKHVRLCNDLRKRLGE